MSNIQSEIDSLKAEVEKCNAAVIIAVRKRKELPKDSPLIDDCNAAVIAAREALTAVEVKIRKLYESKDEGE
jgi:hypothetical protein